MSNNNIAVTSTVIEVISVPTSNFITQVIELHEPIISAAQGPQGIQGLSVAVAISDLTDVSLTNLKDGSLLTFDYYNQIWVASNTIDKQVLDSGQY